MRSHFRMSSREALDDATRQLAALGCVPMMSHKDERLLTVLHDTDKRDEVRRIVDEVDPAANEVLRPEAS